MEILKKSKEALLLAVKILEKGGVVICPTDTVYGFLVDAGNKKAVEKIYKIKKRSKSKPLPVFVKDLKMAKELAEIDARQAKILRKFWPGKYTFVLKLKVIKLSGYKVYGVDKKTIALRIPKHPFLQKLLKKINRPLAQTSANLSGQETLKSTEQLIATFGKNRLVGLIITSREPLGGKSSKIVDLTSEELIRLR